MLKAINKGHGKESPADMDAVIIEDLQIFDKKQAVTEIKIYSNKQRDLERLVVMSHDNIVSIPLHRCEKYKTCRLVSLRKNTKWLQWTLPSIVLIKLNRNESVKARPKDYENSIPKIRTGLIFEQIKTFSFMIYSYFKRKLEDNKIC